jgi:hypothetical protein
MLMYIKNTVYKGKRLHIHRNNKNHILENQNSKHIHCFLIHLNFNKIKINIKNTQIHGLTLKDERLFPQKTFNSAISSLRSLNEK